METKRSFFYTLVTSGLLIWLSASCSRTGNEATPQGTCRIEQLTGRSTSSLYATTYQTTYAYDPQGDLLKTVATSDKRYIAGTYGNQTGTKTTVYTYDTDGYLLASTTDELYQTTTDKVISEKTTMSQSYSYTNGRLSTRTTKRIGAYGITTSTTELFTYNSSGELITKTMSSTSVVHDPTIATEIPVGSGESQQIWTYQNQQLVDYVQKSGASEFRPLTLQNGLVTNYTLPGNQGGLSVAYTYDNQQRVLTMDESLGGLPTNSYVQTWSDTKLSETTLPLYKGWPVVAPEYGKEGVLLTKRQTYRNTVSGKTDTFSEQTTTVQTNSQGFITSSIISVKHPNSSSQDFTTTQTYTYSGCQ